MNLIRRQPWPKRYVLRLEPSQANADEFERLLGEADSEKPLQTFLATHPSFLRLQLPSAQDVWCWDRPRFGAELIPDFLLCRRNSTGFHWTMVELESPAKPALNKSGRPSGKLNEALGQIRDWKIWLRDNIAYARTELAFTDIESECDALAVIGRQAQLEQKQIRRYRELSRDRITVMSYDRILEAARRVAQ